MLTLNRGILAAAATALFAIGCGDTGGGSDAGNTCATDANCGNGRVCHPVLKACVTSCQVGADCPASAKTCARYDGTAATMTNPGFCQCQTDQLCNGGTAGSLICSTLTKQCTDKCTATSCPAGSTCNLTTGQCSGGTGSDGGTDGGTDGGMTGDAGVACNDSNPQPDTCGYGGACFPTMTCDAVVDDRCGNITAAISASNYTAWNQATSTGAIIYTHLNEAGVAAGCTTAGDVPFTVTLYAYAGSSPATFPSNVLSWPGLKYFRSNGTAVDIPGVLVGNTANAWSGITVSNAGKNAEIKFTLCAPSGTTSLQAGFAFTNGNAFCATLAP